MIEKPMIFQGWGVRAILEGRKTMTRRIIKNRHLDYIQDYDMNDPAYGPFFEDEYGESHKTIEIAPHPVGSIIWVRETAWYRPFRTVRMMRDGADTWPKIIYVADGTNEDEQLKEWGWKKKSSIFMPRWASRINLLVKNVKVERVQDIKGKWTNIRKEGIDCPEHDFDSGFCNGPCSSLDKAFIDIWTKINGPESWNQNPWVWVYEFERQ